MKPYRTAIVTLGFSLLLVATGYSAMMKDTPAAHIKPWLGTWSCKSAGNNHTATFMPVFGGNGMRISETGAVPSEEIVTYDTKGHKWIDQYADASGMSVTMAGPQNGKTIRFVQRYPSGGDAQVLVNMASNTMYTTTFSMTANGKKMVQKEVCTRT